MTNNRQVQIAIHNTRVYKAVRGTAVNQAFQPISIAPSHKLKQPRCIFINNIRYSGFTRIFKNIGDGLARTP